MRWLPRVALIAPLLLALAAELHAQGPASHGGAWIGGGVGLGSTQFSCSICRSGRGGGASGYLRAGGTITPQLLLGGETLVWYRSQGDLSYRLGSVQAVAFFYPKPNSGFYLKAGLGVARYTAMDPRDRVSSQALAAQVGVGYELAIGHAFSIAPYANLLRTTATNVRFNSTVPGLGNSPRLLQVGVGLTLH